MSGISLPLPANLSQSDLDSTEGACKKASSDYQARSRAARRIILFDHYGNKCACCGERETGFLTIDHIGGLVPEMKECGRKLGGDNLYKYLVAHHFPPGYQCLCANCNLAISWWGVCPHKARSMRTDAMVSKEVLDFPSLSPVG